MGKEMEFYRENGYILVKDNVRHELLDEMKQRFIEICNGAEDNVTVVTKDPSLKNKGLEGEYLVNRIQDFTNDDCLWKYASYPAVVDIVERIIGPKITVINSMLINKPPNSRKEISLHPLHQDLHYFPIRPADKIVASWTAMERVDQRNGCLYVIPGSHSRQILYEHKYPQGIRNNFYHGVQGLDHVPKTYLEMDKGDTVFFHPLLLHGSGPNITKGFRKAISCHYASSDCHFIDVRGTTQNDLVAEFEHMIRMTGGDMRYEEFIKLKSRIVRGEPGRLQALTCAL
ncbi:phytanoyl-CoA dioxygenase, peroxisomal-like [Cylas formicarius]|uniref:phytanoyl-CoA dioxygenase, peroxisomal-like n=1 Tax=Cylas formicarius TaxID=197179 RepID=UPI00295868D4|nr:phytanoyl-CoA dioxygenase, peroxisomal-like [Cylas formicarius]